MPIQIKLKQASRGIAGSACDCRGCVLKLQFAQVDLIHKFPDESNGVVGRNHLIYALKTIHLSSYASKAAHPKAASKPLPPPPALGSYNKPYALARFQQRLRHIQSGQFLGNLQRPHAVIVDCQPLHLYAVDLFRLTFSA